MRDKVVFLRNTFFKIFLVSFIYYICITLLYIFKLDFFTGIMNTYYKISPQDTQLLCGYYLALVEIITFNLFLIPAIGLHWASRSLKK